MDRKVPKESVVELLKQLEQLKRIKALKEKKLQKLKGCSLKSVKQKRLSSASHTSSKSESGNVKNEGLILNGKKNSSLRNICLPLNNTKSDFKKDSEFNPCEKAAVSNIDKHPEFVRNNSEFDVPTDRIKDALTENMVQEVNDSSSNQRLISDHKNAAKNESFRISDDSVFRKPEIIDIKGENDILILKKQEFSVTDKKLSNNEEKDEKNTSMNLEVVTKSLPDINNDLKLNNSFGNKGESPEVPNKSLPSPKNKSSDILDDSLNSNMSVFLSADLFGAADENDKIEGNQDYCTVTSISKTEITEDVLKEVVSNSKPSSPVYSQPIFINSKQINCGVFNFPKFSTPTEGNTCRFVDDEVSNFIAKSQSTKISNSQKLASNPFIHDDILDKRTDGCVPLKDSFVSPQISYVLEKRLSSVLDAHYESPKKISYKSKNSSITTLNNLESSSQQLINKNFYKKRKLFDDRSSTACTKHEEKNEELKCMADVFSDEKSNNVLGEVDLDLANKGNLDTDNKDAIDCDSDSLDLKNICWNSTMEESDSSDKIPSSVTKTVNGLVAKICKDSLECKVVLDVQESICVNENDNFNVEMKADSEVLCVPETEGLGLYFNKTDTQELLETSTLSESLKEFPARENILNMSSQSKLESPVVNNIVAAVKSSKALQNSQLERDARLIGREKRESEDDELPHEMSVKDKDSENRANDAESVCNDSLNLDTSCLEDDSEDLGKFKQVPYLDEVNVQEKEVLNESKSENESNLNLMCTLHGLENEPVIDVEIIIFCNVKYAIIQHKTHVFVWRQEKGNDWIRVFVHRIVKVFSIEKICVTMNESNLVIVMLLMNEEQYCLQFLLFEKNAKVIKLMENTHWLEERCSGDSVLLCGLHGLMFAISINKAVSDVSVHAFIGLKESPRLMTAVLGSVETPLSSICKIDKLPNALLGIGDSVLYVWHILEARLVTAVSLHPHNYIPIKECFWATVENGLIYFLTTCIGKERSQICQLLAANLATGYCQSAMTYSTRPCNNEVKKILKAVYLEPFLVMAHSDGAFIWSIMEQYCSAALPSKSTITTIAASKDLDKWGTIAVGSKFGEVNCFSLN